MTGRLTLEERVRRLEEERIPRLERLADQVTGALRLSAVLLGLLGTTLTVLVAVVRTLSGD